MKWGKQLQSWGNKGRKIWNNERIKVRKERKHKMETSSQEEEEGRKGLSKGNWKKKEWIGEGTILSKETSKETKKEREYEKERKDWNNEIKQGHKKGVQK